jgi:hypothetical protein
VGQRGWLGTRKSLLLARYGAGVHVAAVPAWMRAEAPSTNPRNGRQNPPAFQGEREKARRTRQAERDALGSTA